MAKACRVRPGKFQIGSLHSDPGIHPVAILWLLGRPCSRQEPCHTVIATDDAAWRAAPSQIPNSNICVTQAFGGIPCDPGNVKSLVQLSATSHLFPSIACNQRCKWSAAMAQEQGQGSWDMQLLECSAGRLRWVMQVQIKQQEIAARKRIIQNPVQMDVIKEKVRALCSLFGEPHL